MKAFSNGTRSGQAIRQVGRSHHAFADAFAAREGQHGLDHFRRVEHAVVAQALGASVSRLVDVGVAGLHRLLNARAELDQADVIIVVAGMEGALPSVVGGLVGKPIIAVPTSVGYGASFGGIAALLAMLNSCAEGIAVVNIDNGFGAAAAAVRILTGARGGSP